jgi:membrane associated rhomboid family serine protease
MLILITFGQAITNKYGSKLIWILYLFGALAGAASMSYGTPHPLITPKVGSEAAISSIVTFYGLLNMKRSLPSPFIPSPMWVI